MDKRKVIVHTTEYMEPGQAYTIRLCVGEKTDRTISISKAVAADLKKEYAFFDVSARRTAYNTYVLFRVASSEEAGLTKVAEISMRFQELLIQYNLRYGTV